MKYQTIETVIKKVGYGGVGLAIHQSGQKILIKGPVVPGATARIVLTKKKKDYYEATLEKIISMPDVTQAREQKCHHAINPMAEPNMDSSNGCGGCKWQFVQYDFQRKIKSDIIQDSFKADFDLVKGVWSGEVLATPNEYSWRNKIEFSFGKYIVSNKNDEKGFLIREDWNLGFHRQGQFSKVIDVDQCHLISEKMHQVFVYIKNKCANSGLPVYDQMRHHGVFRHLVIREGVNTGQILFNLVISDQFFDVNPDWQKKREQFVEDLKNDEFLTKNVTTALVTLNNGMADIVQSQGIQVLNLLGDGYIFEKLNFTKPDGETVQCSFRVSPFSFFQVNSSGAELLFGKAMSMVGEINGPIVDLYCGAGTIGLSFLAVGKGSELVGNELVESAIEDAYHNAKINGLTEKVFFVAGKTEKIFITNPEFADKVLKSELVIVDPPRDGLHKSVVEFLIDLKKQHSFKLLYISCNPQTLARDLRLLHDSGNFAIKKFEAVDMFPQTHHVETIAYLT